jgi:hypothetical protein
MIIIILEFTQMIIIIFCRMHREIGDWPSRYVYGGQLTPGQKSIKSAGENRSTAKF